MNKLKLFLITLLVSLFFFIPVKAYENDDVTIYLFYRDGCPHCASEKAFLSSIDGKYKFSLDKYEVWYDEGNQELYNKVINQLHVKRVGVPLTVIGETTIVGYSGAVEGKIKRAIDYYHENEYVDVVSQIKSGEYVPKVIEDDEEVIDDFSKQEELSDDENTINVPIIGKINLKDVSLSTAALIIGLVDGFNPCAMWVLLFLLSMLIGMKDKKRMWIIGLTFLISSATVYMLIMLSWLNVIVSITTSIILRNIIAVVAIIGGIYNLVNFFKAKDSGCSVVDEKKRKVTFARIKKFTHEKSLILALIGTVALAFSVNIIELACSAGLPLIFTQLLAINKVTGVFAFMYILLYTFFFLFDDLVVFIIALKTMEVTGISTKYSKFSHLIGGILMLIIGILLILKPEILMFQF